MKLEFEELILGLDEFIVSNWSQFEAGKKYIEYQLVSSVREYYEAEIAKSNSAVFDGTTNIKPESSEDVENQIENYKDWREKFNSDRVGYSLQKMDIEKLKEIHLYLMKISLPGECGDFRNIPVNINGSRVQTSHPSEIEDHLDEALRNFQTSNMHPILNHIQFYCRFTQIHPFSEGNGRVIREISNNFFTELGFYPGILPTSSNVNYRKAIRNADEGELEDLIEFFCNLIKDLV